MIINLHVFLASRYQGKVVEAENNNEYVMSINDHPYFVIWL